MSSTQRPGPSVAGRRSPAQRDPAELAPSVDRSWADDFILEQRLLGVPGVRIGDALATIESHVLESGESAAEAFGEAKAYARELADGVRTDETVTTATVAASVLGVVGMLVTVTAFGALLQGERAEVTVGVLAAAVLLLVVLGGFLATATAVLRALVDRLWLVAVTLTVFIGASVALMLLLPQVLVELPAGLLLGVGVLMLVANAVLSWTDGGPDDLVLAPGEDAPEGRSVRYLTTFLLPVAAVLMVGVSWAVHALA